MTPAVSREMLELRSRGKFYIGLELGGEWGWRILLPTSSHSNNFSQGRKYNHLTLHMSSIIKSYLMLPGTNIDVAGFLLLSSFLVYLPIFYLFFNIQRVKSLSQTLGIHFQQSICLECFTLTSTVLGSGDLLGHIK